MALPAVVLVVPLRSAADVAGPALGDDLRVVVTYDERAIRASTPLAIPTATPALA